MNQNILIGLERQAEKLVLQIPAALDSNEYTSLFNEKFAELIVRECVASIPSNGHRGDFGRAVEFCQQQIQQHFGVAE